jgi:diacylglycerol kinase family enzyme
MLDQLSDLDEIAMMEAFNQAIPKQIEKIEATATEKNIDDKAEDIVSVNLDSSIKLDDLIQLLSKGLNNKTVEITIKIKD